MTRHLDAKGYEVTTGIGPDLMEGARAAVGNMIDLLGKLLRPQRHGRLQLCSVCGDLRISEIVDMPNWVVSLLLPEGRLRVTWSAPLLERPRPRHRGRDARGHRDAWSTG